VAEAHEEQESDPVEEERGEERGEEDEVVAQQRPLRRVDVEGVVERGESEEREPRRRSARAVAAGVGGAIWRQIFDLVNIYKKTPVRERDPDSDLELPPGTDVMITIFCNF
jgi:hypothetical protein